jgi:hypothetical protein
MFTYQTTFVDTQAMLATPDTTKKVGVHLLPYTIEKQLDQDTAERNRQAPYEHQQRL